MAFIKMPQNSTECDPIGNFCGKILADLWPFGIKQPSIVNFSIFLKVFASSVNFQRNENTAGTNNMKHWSKLEQVKKTTVYMKRMPVTTGNNNYYLPKPDKVCKNHVTHIH